MIGEVTQKVAALGQSLRANATLKSASCTLEKHETFVVATIPLASANNVVITLPALGICPDKRFTIVAIRAAGQYVDGTVTVVGAGSYAPAALTASGDYHVADNVSGLAWVTKVEVST